MGPLASVKSRYFLPGKNYRRLSLLNNLKLFPEVWLFYSKNGNVVPLDSPRVSQCWLTLGHFAKVRPTPKRVALEWRPVWCNPLRGCWRFPPVPRGARSWQPWALMWNGVAVLRINLKAVMELAAKMHKRHKMRQIQRAQGRIADSPHR